MTNVNKTVIKTNYLSLQLIDFNFNSWEKGIQAITAKEQNLFHIGGSKDRCL